MYVCIYLEEEEEEEEDRSILSNIIFQMIIWYRLQKCK